MTTTDLRRVALPAGETVPVLGQGTWHMAEDPRRRIVLFLRPLNPELERWDGYRQPIGPELKASTGFTTVMFSGRIPPILTIAPR